MPDQETMTDHEIEPELGSTGIPVKKRGPPKGVRHGGKPKGYRQDKYFLWRVTVTDKDTGEVTTDRYLGIEDINEKKGWSLNYDYVRRMTTGHKVDQTGRNGKNSFIQRYGHIKLEKIRELNPTYCLGKN